MSDYNHIIPLDDWQADETYDGIFPKGAREKTIYFSPDNPTPSNLIPNHRYLFKKSSHRYPWQFWMEIIAFRVGQVMGVQVPPAYVATSIKEAEPGKIAHGALIEWFYDDEDIYIDGGRFMSHMIEGFDAHKGTQHNLATILDIALFQKFRDDIIHYWAGVLTFDTVIGNVDRHQDNWGVLIKRTNVVAEIKDMPLWPRLSPAFDNGTALGYEIIEDNILKFEDDAYLKRYLTRPKHARHHMWWSLADMGDMNFFDFMGRFLKSYPQERETVMNLLRFTQGDIEERLCELPQIAVADEYRLTQQRLDFTIHLIMKRKEMLENILEVY